MPLQIPLRIFCQPNDLSEQEYPDVCLPSDRGWQRQANPARPRASRVLTCTPPKSPTYCLFAAARTPYPSMKADPVISLATRQRLEKAARAAAGASYSPYSKFPVGAAVLADSGRIYSGCNVENASYGLCNCAERTAIFTATAAGERKIQAVAVYTPTARPTAPCGACRQVINEFGAHAAVICVCNSSQRIETTLPALLGEAFGPQNLLNASRRPVRHKVR